MKFFALKYFILKYFKNFSMFFPALHFYKSNITFHSFMHTAAPEAYLQAYLLGLLV